MNTVQFYDYKYWCLFYVLNYTLQNYLSVEIIKEKAKFCHNRFYFKIESNRILVKEISIPTFSENLGHRLKRT